MATVNSKVIYWHRELPPLDAEAIGEHTLETTSMHVPGTLAHRDELWAQCYADLMANVSTEAGAGSQPPGRALCPRIGRIGRQ